MEIIDLFRLRKELIFIILLKFLAVVFTVLINHGLLIFIIIKTFSIF
jgi:hypothetical protein